MAEFLRKILSRHNWRGLCGLLLHARDPLRVAWRFYRRRGAYPFAVGLRTPIGPITLGLWSHEDLVTVHEVFFRQDYRSGAARTLRVAVDFGANIGITTAWLLTRNPGVRVFSYEPVPGNVARARQNLAKFGSRLEFNACAVGTHDGIAQFGVEPSGRYGGIGLSGLAQIEVPCRRGEDELRAILARARHIDLLKLDIEGMEWPVLASLSAATLAGIDAIVAECEGSAAELPGFTCEQYLSVAHFRRMDAGGAAR